MTNIFVFGSNLAGRHGKGAALEAVQSWGAINGQGWGRQGDAYAIPTKDFMLKTLPLPMIRYFARVFLVYAWQHPQDRFKLTPIGCGLAGYKPAQIAPFFDQAPRNVCLPYSFHY